MRNAKQQARVEARKSARKAERLIDNSTRQPTAIDKRTLNRIGTKEAQKYLSDVQSQVLSMTYQGHLKQNDIAMKLGLSQSGVSQALRGGLFALRNKRPTGAYRTGAHGGHLKHEWEDIREVLPVAHKLIDNVMRRRFRDRDTQEKIGADFGLKQNEIQSIISGVMRVVHPKVKG